MTTVRTFEDILDAMRRNPALSEAMRQHVGDEEVTNRILAELMEVKAGHSLIVSQQDRIEADLTYLKAGHSRMEARQDRIEARQDRMEADITDIKTSHSRMEARQDRMEADITDIKASHSRMEARQDRMEARQDRMESDITDIKTIQDRMQGQLNNLTGTDYERKIAKGSPRTVRRYLDIRNAQLVHSLTNLDNPHLFNLLEQATETHAISDDQADDLVRADIILLGQTTSGEPAYAVVEVSVTIDEHDVDRASRRARILQTASDVATKAAVIGTAISDANRQRATADSVTFVAIAE